MYLILMFLNGFGKMKVSGESFQQEAIGIITTNMNLGVKFLEFII